MVSKAPQIALEARFGWLNRDPVAEHGGINLYALVRNSPVTFSDPVGLTLYKCTRPSGPPGGQHVYLWDDTTGVGCGMGGNVFRQRGVDNPGDKGPKSGHTCAPVPNSCGKEKEVMQCCRDKKAIIFRPFFNDCHAFVDDCLTENALSNPVIFGRWKGPVDLYQQYCAENPDAWICNLLIGPFPKLASPGPSGPFPFPGDLPIHRK